MKTQKTGPRTSQMGSKWTDWWKNGAKNSWESKYEMLLGEFQLGWIFCSRVHTYILICVEVPTDTCAHMYVDVRGVVWEMRWGSQVTGLGLIALALWASLIRRPWCIRAQWLVHLTKYVFNFFRQVITRDPTFSQYIDIEVYPYPCFFLYLHHFSNLKLIYVRMHIRKHIVRRN